MTDVARSVRSLLALLLLAPTLAAQAADPAVTNKLPSPPSQQKSPKATPAESPKPVEQPITATPRPTGAASEPNLQEIVRAAQKANVEARRIVIGNLVNAEMPAYKRQIPSFATVPGGSLHREGEGHDTKVIPASYFVGVRLAPPLTDMRAGKLRRTGRDLDLAIEGEGFFQVQPAGDDRAKAFYCTRCGRFAIDSRGRMVLRGLKHDWILTPSLEIPEDAFDIKITADGVVSLLEPPDGADAKAAESRCYPGTIRLVSFYPDCELTPCGDNVFLVDFKKHKSIGVGVPGAGKYGVLRQHCLEESNVDPQQEFETLQKLQEQANVLEQAAQLLKVTNGPVRDQIKPPVK